MQEKSPTPNHARSGRLGPLALALLALGLAFWAQSLIRQPQIMDALILFGAAATLFILAIHTGAKVPETAPSEESLSATQDGHRATHSRSRWHRGAIVGAVGVALLMVAVALNLHALALFPGTPTPAIAWFVYFGSVGSMLVGFNVLKRAGGQGCPHRRGDVADKGTEKDLTLPLSIAMEREDGLSPSSGDGHRLVSGHSSVGTKHPHPNAPLAAGPGSLHSRGEGTNRAAFHVIAGFASRHRVAIVLALIIAVAAFFRLYRLDIQPNGLFYDEAMNGLDAQHVLAGGDFPVFFTANYGRGPLYIYLLAALVKLLGPSALTLRLASAFIGIVAVPAMFLFARLIFGTRLALIAALLLAVARWHVNFSRIAFDAILLPLLLLLLFYFTIKALRSGKLMDFVWAGMIAALGLDTYVAFRLLPLVAGAYILYVLLLRRRVNRRIIAGVGALVFAGVLVASPFMEYYFQHPESANQRVAVVNVFADKSVQEGFSAALEGAGKHILMFNREGDRNGRHNLPGEPMLDYVTGALFAIGLGYALRRAREPTYALLLLTFATMLAAGILSLDFEAPQALRAIGTLPIALVFASIAFDRLMALTLGLGKLVPRAILGGLALLLVGTAILNYNDYFVRQANNFASWNAFSTGEALAASEMKALGGEWRYYVSSLYYNTPTLRFLAPEITRYGRVEGTDWLPLQEVSNDNVALLLDPQKTALFAEAKRFYPNAVVKQFVPPMGGPPGMLEVQLRQSDLTRVQGLAARYFEGTEWAGAPKLERRDANIAVDWANELALSAPFSVEWQGILNVAKYGRYLVGMRSPGPLEAWLDENKVLATSGETTVSLAKGNHALRIRAVVPETAGRTEFYWQPPGEALSTVPVAALYTAPVSNNGLLASYYRNLDWSGEPAFQQIDPSLAIYYQVTPLPRPYSVEWRGKVEAVVGGDYAFGLESIDDSELEIDGRRVVAARVANRYEEGRAAITPGWHEIRVRYVDKSGWSHVNLYWTPPGTGREIIPAERLLPPQGSYPSVAAPGVRPPASTSAELSVIGKLIASIGDTGQTPARLNQPKDVIVAGDGTVFVADSGNGRVAHFDGGGRFLNQIGRPGDAPGELRSPNALALAPDGDLLVLDEATSYINRFSPDGTFRQRLGGPAAGFYHPRGIAAGADATIYVADTGMARIVAFAPNGTKLREFGGKGSAPGQLLGPVGIAVDGEGKLWVADVDNNRIQRLGPNGEYLGSFAIPPGETVDGAHLALGDRALYLSDPIRNRIIVHSFEGRVLGQLPALGRPVGIAIDKDGNVWVAERDGNRVQALD